MRKNKLFFMIIFLILITVTLVGCGEKKSTQENIREAKQSKSTFSIKYNGVEVVPGTEFNENLISEEANFSEIPSCAFEGTDKMYTYSGVELVVTNIDGKDKVYSVYFITDDVKTAEGVGITDTVNKMIEVYGENYDQSISNKYTYTKGEVELSFIVQNNVITSVEYVLKTNS